ncbi:MAG: methyltransferase domain-containing protein [Bdellovibrionales bacterium]|nr:methyltransferase domain-containing protein [Bdellovibrionales bacterium]
MFGRIFVCLMALTLLLPQSFAKTPHGRGHKPGEMNKKFLDPKLDPKPFSKEFEEKNRDVISHRQEILKAAAIQSGNTVVDLGAGTGSFLKGLSDKVGPQGKVIAVDISPAFITFMKTRSENEKIKNVDFFLNTENTIALPSGSVDVVICIDTYHHFEHPEKMLGEIRRILKPEGKFIVIDFKKTPHAREWIRGHIRTYQQGYVKEISDAGFYFVREELIPFKESFMLTFQMNPLDADKR